MPSYELTKIYKITNDINDKIYIGATTYQYLCNRLNVHKQHTKDNSNRRNSPMNNEMKLLGVEHFKIELIENFPCSNKKEMVEKEQYYIDLLKPQLNKFRSIEDPEYEKKRYIRDKDKRLLLSKNNYNKNKEKIAEKGKVKFTCECGSICRISDKSRHLKSNKHTSFIKIY
jgi:hypothetical protein